ncbi:YhcN/YlaJ family sporulation lipoprotein [Paenibacillus oenotherae]|uniref:YhcN/YlaJ family sporulation lipoprotein n=1 Tax=Paenibacillus oenotherae TaxID=1435645 RepID=A0ABS7D3N2_9BACL|nr:YhcN/YlaJ family sporulation lipoprotein [Paenibacillus oenotherae]MBW7474539.1 YhcN/YlaJ family sporulation lipoprotein [Paenibacillus oenotherae]
MQRKWVLIAAVAALSTMLAGCSDKQGDLGNRNIRENNVRYDMSGNRIMSKRFADDQNNEMNRKDGRRLNSNNIIGLHKNYRLEMSEEVADQLAAMKEVNKAYVMLTDNNAYVAVSLDDGKKKVGPNAMSRSQVPSQPLGRTNQGYRHLGVNGSKDFSAGVYDGSRMKGLDSKVTEDLKSQIAGKVKGMVPQVDNVYVSANPDFVDRMTAYMDDVRLGHPIQGFIVEFNAMVDRIFPHQANKR